MDFFDSISQSIIYEENFNFFEMAIKLELLRIFCVVAETGNLADAAERLGRTQSALSMSLKHLESHLGKVLFSGERKSHLSPLGEQVFDLAQNQIRQFDKMVQSVEATANASNGLVSVASVPSMAALVFPQLLGHMADQIPGVKIELRDTDTRQVLDSLTNGKADVGIASGYHSLNSVVATPLYEDQFGLVGAADHPLLTQRKPPSTEDVVTSMFIRNTLCDLITDRAFRNSVKHVNMTIHNNHSLINTISEGRWVSVLPESVTSYLPSSVAFRSISDLPDKREVWLYRRERAHFKEAVDACCNFIESIAPNH